jgi:hypothetical protein
MCTRRVFISLLSILTLSAATPCLSQIVYRQAGAPWYVDISTAKKDSASDAIITWLGSSGGWGLGHLQIDYSLRILTDNGTAPMRTFTKTDDFFDGECDYVPMPVPVGGALEGETGYECLSDGDCHLIVMQTSTKTLYEMWRANIAGGVFYGGCLAVWHLDNPYNVINRGDQCTSADAAGLPIAPLLFTADEVSAGTIDHAVRFALPNNRIRHLTYVRPATHATGAASGGDSAVPYGARLRLKSSYDISGLPTAGAKVLAQCLKKYGMILADGGNVALMGMNDGQSVAKWDALLGTRDLQAIPVSAFEMVSAGQRYTWTGDCTLIPVRDPLLTPRSAQCERPKVFASGHSIKIQGRLRSAVRIFGVSGRIAAQCTMTGPETVFSTQAPGVYMVEVAGALRSRVIVGR